MGRGFVMLLIVKILIGLIVVFMLDEVLVMEIFRELKIIICRIRD